ncbi:MAG: diacylglycerol kinase family lipid kinase [Saprospiraceae bacterium]|nr:diacylglycerol kinase family lipid kinase [Saprospiraceae bacterium]
MSSTAIKKKIRFITNPFSGTKSKAKLNDMINEHLDTNIFDYEICYTEYPKHATLLSAEARDKGYFAVAAVGGDGTINEVATSLVGSTTALAVVPHGSGNGFSYHLGLRRDVAGAIRAINSSHLIYIDTGLANDRFFINVAGLGLDATVAFKTKLNKRRGFIPYFINTLKESIGFRFMHLKITTEDRISEQEYAMAVIANGSIYGYDFAIAPSAVLYDGMFDIILVKKAHLFRYFFLVSRMLNKSFHKSPLVDFFRSNKITIENKDTDGYFHVDGEGFVAASSITFEIRPASLLLISKKD